VSRSLKQFKVASVLTLFKVREDPSVPVHPSGRRGYIIRTPFNVFCLKTQLWEDGCNRPDDVLYKARRAYKVQPSGRQSSWSG
jgi:hypothetical protein